MSRKPRNSVADETLHVYTRVSTAAQRDEGTSLQTQLEQGKARAKQLGLKVKHWDEGGRSSHHEEIAARPTLASLFQAITNGEVKHLFVYDQSRLSRNDNVASVFRYECNKQGVTLYTKDGQFDLANPQDKFLKQILDGLSEFDNAMRAERTRLGKLNRTRSGGWHGGPPPYGYELVDRRLVIEKTEAKWVKRIFSEALNGSSPQKIKSLLDSNAVSPRRGGIWTIGSVAALLKNSHYAGSYQYKDRKSAEIVTVTCPAILDPDLWRSVQLKRTRKFSRVLQQNPTRHFYLLRDLMYCGHCGRPIAGRQRESKREKFYYCANKERDWAKKGRSKTPWKRGTGCGMTRALNLPETEELVFKAVMEIHRNSHVIRQEAKNRATQLDDQQSSKSEKEIAALNLKLRRLERQIATTQELLGVLEGKYDLGKISKKQFEGRQRVYKESLEMYEVEANNTRLGLKGDALEKRLKTWYFDHLRSAESKANLSPEEKKNYIAGLVERIEVRYLKATDQHELTLRFYLPVVNDWFKWNNPGKRRLGYTFGPGVHDLPLRIDKKDRKNTGKRFAP